MIGSLLVKELKALFTDGGILLLAIGGPLLYSVLYPFPYREAVVRDIPVAIIDMDKTPSSLQLARMIDATEEVRAERGYASLPAALAALSEREIYGLVYIEKGFQKDILRNKPQKVKIYTDGSYIIYYKQVTSGLQRAIKTMSAGAEIKKLQARGAGKAAYVMRSPIKLVGKNLYNPSGNYMEYVVPAVFVTVIHQILLMAIGMRAGTLRERRNTYAPHITPMQILLSKIGAFMTFGIFYFFFFFVLMYNIFGFSGGGSVFQLLLFYIPFMLSVILLGICLSSLFKERETSIMFIVVSSFPLFFMAGSVWPPYQMAWFIKIIRLCVPLTYGINGTLRLFVMGADFANIMPLFLACCGLCAVFGFMAYRVIKKRYPLKI